MDKKEINLLFENLNKINQKLDKLLEKDIDDEDTITYMSSMCLKCSKYLKSCGGLRYMNIDNEVKEENCPDFTPNTKSYDGINYNTDNNSKSINEHKICAITMEKCYLPNCATCPHGKKGNTVYA